MINNVSLLHELPNEILFPSVVIKFIAMIIGVGGNTTVIIYTIFLSKEKTMTSYLVGNLALADLMMCLTFYPIWIIEIIETILNIESDQNLFCKFSRSSSYALLFASVATLLAITVNRYLYLVRPLTYPLIVTKRRVFTSILGIWLTTGCIFFIFVIFVRRSDDRMVRSFCDINESLQHFMISFVAYIPLCLIIILNVGIFIVVKKQRKKFFAQTVGPLNSSNQNTGNKIATVIHLFQTLKAIKTFCVVVAVLVFCVLTPAVAGRVIYESSCTGSCRQLWFVVFHYEFYGINSIINAFIYGMRHNKYRKAYGEILFKILRCKKLDS